MTENYLKSPKKWAKLHKSLFQCLELCSRVSVPCTMMRAQEEDWPRPGTLKVIRKYRKKLQKASQGWERLCRYIHTLNIGVVCLICGPIRCDCSLPMLQETLKPWNDLNNESLHPQKLRIPYFFLRNHCTFLSAKKSGPTAALGPSGPLTMVWGP